MSKSAGATYSVADAAAAVREFERTNALLLKKLAASKAPFASTGHIYAHGWAAKLAQATFALQRLEQLASTPTTDSASSTADFLNYSQQVSFYTDAFWAFLYATFDIGAQLINQVDTIGESERDVAMNPAFVAKIKNPAIKKAVDAATASSGSKSAKEYRNTSLHRRDIAVNYLETRSCVMTSYSMMTSASPMTKTPKFLCDDPLTPSPTFAESRPIIGFSAECLAKTADHLKSIANAVKKAIP